MDKKKILKIIILLMALILIVFVIATTRKVIILSSLKNKAEEYRKNSDIHMKTNYEDVIIETFVREDICKFSMHYKDKNETIIQVDDYKAKERRIYWDAKDEKLLQIIKNDYMQYGERIPIFTFADSMSFFEMIVNSINSKVYTQKIDGEEYYVIEGVKNTNFVYAEDVINAKGYINKKTGLKTEMITTVEENGKQIEKIATYEYSFDKITDEDLKEPDRTGYKIMEL